MLGSNIGDFFNALATGIENFRFTDAVDIIIMTFIFFWLVSFFKKMGAGQLLRGFLIVVVFFYLLSNLFELTMLSWLIDKLLISGIIFIAIVFQPELRRTLDHLGRQRIVGDEEDEMYDELVQAIQNLSQRHVGALILLERNESLQNIVETGVEIDSKVNNKLIENIFEDKTPLHDGAIVIRKGRIDSAACIIPLSSDLPPIPQKYGTRHRAAVSATINSDCVALIVSEETGCISYAQDGVLHEEIDSVVLKNLVRVLRDGEPEKATPAKKLVKKLFGKKEE